MGTEIQQQTQNGVTITPSIAYEEVNVLYTYGFAFSKKKKL